MFQTLDSVDSMGDTMADDALVYLDSMDYVENGAYNTLHMNIVSTR